MTKIQRLLFQHQDSLYADFISKLIPDLPRKIFIGIRSPEYRKILKEIHALPEKEIDVFLKNLPHEYHEENKLHIALINETKDYDRCISLLESFLPYITNWDVSDSLRPKVFEKNKQRLIKKLPLWISDSKPFTIRVGILFLMKFFLDEDFDSSYLELVSRVRSDEYYVNMMIAWFFQEALYKQWESAIVYIEEKRLPSWTHNKAIQKSKESFRIPEERKEYLESLKVKVQRKNVSR